MTIKAQQLEVAPTIARAEVRETLVELWAQIFEAELRADLEGQDQARLVDAGTPGAAIGEGRDVVGG